MINTRANSGPFPTIESINDIRENRCWVLGVFRRTLSSPSQSDFTNALYFQCEGDRRDILSQEIEVWKPLGTTNLSDDAIKNLGTRSLPLSNSISLIFIP